MPRNPDSENTVHIDTTRVYLDEIGSVPLLKKEELALYCEDIQAGLHAEAVLAEMESDIPHREELEETQRRGQEALNAVVSANLRLVVTIAKKYSMHAKNLEFMDLVQEGSIGLRRAAEKFQPDKGFAFSTYAVWWIRQAIGRAISSQGRIIHMPHQLSEDARTYLNLTVDLKNGDNPVSEQEIADFMNLPLEKVRKIARLAVRFLEVDSLDVEFDDGVAVYENRINDAEAGEPYEEVDVNDEYSRLRSLIDSAELTDAEREVLNLRYRAEKLMPFYKISASMRKDRKEISALHQSALQKLRHNYEDSESRAS